MKGLSILAAFLGGAVVGAAAGILFAPESGEDTRSKIADALRKRGIKLCTEIGAGKERPDIYLAAAKALGTHPADTWVFEDALYAIKTAKAAGFYTVGLYDETSRNDQEAIAGLADCYVREIQSVPTQDCT